MYDQYPRSSVSDPGGTTTNMAGTLIVTGAGLDAAGAATKYLTAVGSNHAAAQVVLAVVPEGYTNIRDLYLNLATASGGTDTYAVTVQKSTDYGATWTDTTLTCTATGTAKYASDTSHVPAVAARTVLAIKIVSSAGTAAAATATFILS